MTENENQELPSYCKDFLYQIGPIDSLLGSLSYNEIDNTDGKTQQLRTSARVFKKMKFDLSNNAASEKKEKKEEVKPEEVKPEIKKPVNPLWTSTEKTVFFEALNEFGKDFESIHMHICTRLKKKGVPDDQLKTKHQIRHFYYKTFHMLCGSNLKFNQEIPKNVQELYTLINYGELRKKFVSLPSNKKILSKYSKLADLIANGSLPIKLKGKTIKVKTPMCRALRRLNQLDEKYDDLKLPTRVLVELRPKDMISFVKIQSMAQNPRIKIALSLQKRLSSLITCLNTRWKDSEALVYDKAVISTNPVTKDCVPDQKEIDERLSLLTPLLRLAPPFDAHVELPSIDISEYFTGQSISLKAFETRKCIKKEVKKEEVEPISIKVEKSSPTKQTSEEGTSDSAKTVNKAIDETVNTLLSLKTQEKHHTVDNKSEVKQNPRDMPLEEKRARIAQIRQGWTVENCGTLTIGEIYLMCGADSKMVLEYNWDPLQITSLKVEDDKKTNYEGSDLSNSLKKLLSIAKLHSEVDKSVGKCTCGHVCGTKNSAHFKKPLSTKVVKKSTVNQEITVMEEKLLEETIMNVSTAQEIDEDLTRDQQFLDRTNSVVQLFHQRDNLERLNPRMRNRCRGRFRQLVVERKLVPNKLETKHQIVSMNLISQENTRTDSVVSEENENESKTSVLPSLLGNKTDTCMSEKSFRGLLDNDGPSSNMSTGITKILKENENQWISSEVADYSLSSLLGHLDCPSKSGDEAQLSQMSQDVDAQLHTLMIESSIDYTAQFADLAAVVESRK